MQGNSVIFDLQPLMDRVEAIEKQHIPFAASLALNSTAFKVREQLNLATLKYFDRPVPFTQRGFAYSKSNKKELVAYVFPEARRARYLNVQIEGGGRKRKKYESFFRNISGTNLLQVVPAKEVLNAQGNPARGIFRQIQSNLNDNSESGYFIGQPKRNNGPGLRPMGVYKRQGRTLKPLFTVQRRPRYKPLFPFYDIGDATANYVWPEEFNKAFKRALDTAR